MIFHTVVRPFLLKLQCREPEPPAVYKARLAVSVEGAKGRRALYSAVLIARGGGYVAYPLYAESGAISVLARADGYFVVPETVELMAVIVVGVFSTIEQSTYLYTLASAGVLLMGPIGVSS